MKIKFLNEIKTYTNAGLKAYNLSILKKEGFLIPNAFVVSRKDVFSKEEKKKILQEILKLKSNKIAIRSSSNLEDSASFSWAGQFKTFLNIDIKNTKEILEKIEEIFDSINSKTVLNYKKNNKIKDDIKISVIVQEMIQSEKSGVSFSINPITKNNDEILINSHFGLGDKLVDGKISADEFLILKKNIKILEKKGQSLSAKEIEQISKITKKIESIFSHPVDIEWGIQNKKLFILQARPIIIREELNIFDNSNIAESYAGITSPLSFSFAREAYREVYKNFARLMGVSEKEIQKNKQIFESMIIDLHYHFYYNLINWYHLISLFPFYKISKKLMENMMGVSKSFRHQIQKKKKKGFFILFPIVAWKILKISYTFTTLESKMKKFNTFFDEYYQKELETDLSSYSIADLEKRYRKLEHDLIKNWRIPIANDFAVMVSVGLSKILYKKWTDKNNFYDFIKIDKDIISTETGIELIKLKKVALKEQIDFNLSDNEILTKIKSMKKGNSFKKSFYHYIKKYSVRVPNELKLETETLETKPEQLIQQLRFSQDSLIKSKENTEIAGLNFFKKNILSFFFKWSQNSIARREEGRFRRAQAFNLIRKLFIQSGVIFKNKNKIENPRDIFYLQVDEIFYTKYLDYKRLIIDRKKEIKNTKSLKLKKRYEFFTTKERLEKYITTTEEKEAKIDNNLLSGKVTSSGEKEEIRGEVIIMKKFDWNVDFKNKILVTKHTDPGWTPIFPFLKAIIIENGSTLSHASIVAREFEIPCIVGVKNATTIINQKDIVSLNLTSGIIKKNNIKKNMLQ